MKKNAVHPGIYVRENVIPVGVTVTQAAQQLKVGRPALSNFLNGNAALSPEMASKLEKAFGVDARKLTQLQIDYENSCMQEQNIASDVARYVPPFLQAKATEIETWASGNISARTRFPVFLRTLMHSTCTDISFIDFPGNDDGERKGWDGEVKTDIGSAWVPAGHSVWEFGTNKSIKDKADGDYKNATKKTKEDDAEGLYNTRTKSLKASERKNMHFVFVTPRRWKEKKQWCTQKQLEGKWKSVRAYDASDLEQWMEQSIPAQIWFANERGQDFKGTYGLANAWNNKWNADCDPAFTLKAFEEAVESHGDKLIGALRSDPTKIVTIAADSLYEALAFIYAVFEAYNDNDVQLWKNNAVIFSEPGTLPALLKSKPGFLPILADMNIEKELSESGCKVGGIVFVSRGMARDPDITLDVLSYGAFESGLLDMGKKRDAIERLRYESGKSLTVLRRRLKRNKMPEWANNIPQAQFLFSMMFAGAWASTNIADQEILKELCACASYEEVENTFNILHGLAESPLWKVGKFRGVVSKIDILHSMAGNITANDLRRFQLIAELVLSEKNPALELEESERWAAGLYQKTREISSALRKGIADSLVVLAIYGDRLLFEHTGEKPSLIAYDLVKKLLHTTDMQAFESQEDNFYVYAEAAPEAFLKCLQDDMKCKNSCVFNLLRPCGAMPFSSPSYSNLLWALEMLAWSEKYIWDVIKILAELSLHEPKDNWCNKPSSSLEAIFRAWMPQTAVTVEGRIKLFEKLAREYSEIAWDIAIKQFEPFSQTGMYSHKPRWRDDALGHGNVVTKRERHEFVEYCVKLCLDWPSLNALKLKELLRNINGISPDHQVNLWEKIRQWGSTASDSDIILIREAIRRYVSLKNEAAKLCYDALEPKDLVYKHAWLFKNAWVDESYDALQSKKFDYKKNEERVKSLRCSALEEVLKAGGYHDALRLAFSGDASHLVGHYMHEFLETREDRLSFIKHVLQDSDITQPSQHRSLLCSLFHRLGSSESLCLVKNLRTEIDVDENCLIQLLCECPFVMEIWRYFEKNNEESFSGRYWEHVNPGWCNNSEEELNYATNKLIEAGRPAAALHFSHINLKKLTSDLLRRLLTELPTTSEDDNLVRHTDSHDIKEIFKILTERKAFSLDDMASLEFAYIDLFRNDEEGIPNIEAKISDNPAWFCEAVSLAYLKDDKSRGKQERDPKLTQRAYKLLHAISKVPNPERNLLTEDEYSQKWTEHLLQWIDNARAIFERQGQKNIGEYCIGELLAQAPVGQDGIWPCEPVREVIDRVYSERMSEGFIIAHRNSRGAHWRGEGGNQERELANKYEGWAKECSLDLSNMAKIFHALSEAYLHEADWQDNEAKIRTRLDY